MKKHQDWRYPVMQRIIDERTSERDAAYARIAALVTERDTWRQTANHLEAKVALLAADVLDAERRVMGASSTVTLLRDDLASSRRALKSTRKALTDARKRVALARASLSDALGRAREAEAVSDGLREENDALRAQIPQSELSEHELGQPTSIFSLQYPELIRAHKLIKALYAAPDGEYAAVANRVLQLIGEITETADPWRKSTKGRAA